MTSRTSITQSSGAAALSRFRGSGYVSRKGSEHTETRMPGQLPSWLEDDEAPSCDMTLYYWV